MEPRIIIVGLLGLVCLGALAFVFFAPTTSGKQKSRLAKLETNNNARRAATTAQNEAVNKDRRKKVADTLAKLEADAKENKKKKRLTLEQQFEQAGLDLSTSNFYMGSAICAVLLGFIGFISGQKTLITLGLVFIGGIGFPRWFVGFAIKRRQKKFAGEFSNAIDVIVRGVKSGLPVNECLKIIAKEAPKPVNEEFHQLTEGIRIGLSMEQGLERMHERMPLKEVRFFGIVLMIQQQTGGNLAEALGNLSGVLRGRKVMEGKIQALSAEAKASALIVGFLPIFVTGAVSVSAPGYLDPLFITKPGNMILIGAGIWMGIGIFIMKSMIKIKV